MQCVYPCRCCCLPVHASVSGGGSGAGMGELHHTGNATLHSRSTPRHPIFVFDPICIACGPHGMDPYSIVTNAVATRPVAVRTALNC